ncbi:MAG: iron ABC transporter permease [Candidatus Rokubacteria bacterium]|nr:iron ABC transporter permease [Candidatus Rokubacteria bacterium]
MRPARTLGAPALVALGAGLLVLPWYALPEGAWSVPPGGAPGARPLVGWLMAPDSASAVVQALRHGRAGLAAPLLVAAAAALSLGLARAGWPPLVSARRPHGWLFLVLGLVGLTATLLQGFAIRQPALGLGAVVALASFVLLAAEGLAVSGALRGDRFAAACLLAIAVLVALFVFLPLARVLAAAVQGQGGAPSAGALLGRLTAEKIWTLACLTSARRCGVAWNTIALALACAGGTTLLGLALALLVTRSTLPLRRLTRLVAVLPVITPPFVIGLGIILICGRAGVINAVLESTLGVPPSRWIYGFPGLLLAQLFAFTPVAFLVLIGVVEGLSPTLEEAGQTLGARSGQVFRTVSLPLMLPGLANAFLVGFIESIADFGNPLVLGGSFNVLATEVYFALVGAQYDQGRAAALAMILLLLALGAFVLQRRLLRGRAFTSVTGKGDAGIPVALPRPLVRAIVLATVPWLLFTLVIYGMALVGGFVAVWGRDHTLTLRHFAKAFAVEWTGAGILWTGGAWTSLWNTVRLAAVAAPLSAALGLLTAWLLGRTRFAGQRAFELATLLSFAVPGTVIGIAYVLAFNVPPLELTGSGLIIVLCLMFRNMPVGVRGGLASLEQIDRSLDEASNTLGARGAVTVWRVLLPLVKPAVGAALVYGFVRSVTTVSAVIFLVSGDTDMATTYIIGRVVNGDYGVAIAYSAVLIALMVAAIVLIQRLVGVRVVGARTAEGAS